MKRRNLSPAQEEVLNEGIARITGAKKPRWYHRYEWAEAAWYIGGLATGIFARELTSSSDRPVTLAFILVGLPVLLLGPQIFRK